MQTVEEIYDDMTAEEAADGALSELDTSGDTATSLAEDVSSQSRVSRHRIIKWIVSYLMWVQRVLWEVYKVDVINLSRDGHFSTGRWFVQKAYEFQYGDNFILTSKDGYYDPVVPANRIVAQAASEELGYKVILKVAKASGSGLTKLSQDERIALQDHFNEYRVPVKVEVRSADADRIRIDAKVICDAKLGIANIKSNVELAINTYLSKLRFDGKFRNADLKDAMRGPVGVVDVQLIQVQMRVAGSSVWTNVERIRSTNAGYVKVDQEFPLDDTIEYVSSNV